MDADKEQLWKSARVALGISAVLILLVLLVNAWTKKRESAIVLPGGVTYLGPPPKADPASPDTWKKVSGTIYPYAFEVPETITLVSFPDDPYDIRAIEWPGQQPSDNVLIGVEDDVNQPLETYIDTWWKQFALTGIDEKVAFTNSQGLKGYNVTFRTASGASPYQDVFLGEGTIVIHMANKVLPEEVFARIVDSVSWKSQ